MKCGRVIINSADEFSVAAKKDVPSIATLFQKENDLLCEPDDINQSPFISAAWQIQKFVRSSTAEGGTIIDFYFLSMEKNPAIVIFGKEMWSRGGRVWIFIIVSLALRLLYVKVLRGKWGWKLVKMSIVLPVVSWKVLRAVAIMWFDGQ